MPEFCKNRARVQLGGALAGMLVAALATPAMSQEAARRSAAADAPDRQRWTVVLDPGHGGIDKGADCTSVRK